jgi:hypothetical protein
MRRTALLLTAALFMASSSVVLAQAPQSPPQSQPGTPKPQPRTTQPDAKKPAPKAANQYDSEMEAKRRCGTDTVVWFNPSSKVYHLAGTRDYGKTKKGAYMCRTDADRVGRAAKGAKPKS